MTLWVYDLQQPLYAVTYIYSYIPVHTHKCWQTYTCILNYIALVFSRDIYEFVIVNVISI